MDSGREKSLNSDDGPSCRTHVDNDDDDDEDTADRAGHFHYCPSPRASSGTAISSDNYCSENSPVIKGLLWNSSDGFGSYAKAQFERQVAQKDAIDCGPGIDRFKHLCDFDVDECGEVLTSENANELEKTGAKDAVLVSCLRDGYNELVHKNNSECFDEELSCDSEDNKDDDEEACCDAGNDCCRLYNSLIHEHNTEQFDEVLSVDSDEDSAETKRLQRGFLSVKEAVEPQSKSEPKELADSDFEVKVPESKVKTNGYDAASHRKSYGSKYSGATTTSAMSSVERCNSLLSTCGYVGGRSLTMDNEKKREILRPFFGSDHESEIDASCGLGNKYQAARSDDSDDFFERNSELNIQHPPFFSQQDELRFEKGTGDFVFRGNTLHGSSLRGYSSAYFPPYHLTRYGFNSELEQHNLLSSRYYQLRMKRQSKRERQEAAVVKSTDVPGYKGNLDVDELLSYINDSKDPGHRSEIHGGVDTSLNRSAEKAGKRRKKGGSRGTETSGRVESCSNSTNKRTGDAKVDLTIKTNERVRVKSRSKLNCANFIFNDEKNLCDISLDREIGDDLTSRRVGDSNSASRATCDIPQGNADSIKTPNVDRQLDKALTQSSSSPVLRSTFNDVSTQRDDDFTMVTKKKNLKKNNSKRAKLPRFDRLPCFPVSSDSLSFMDAVHDFTSPFPTASKEPTFDCYQSKTRNGTLSKSSSTFKPPVDRTLTQDCGLGPEAHDEKMDHEVQKKLARVYGKAVYVHTVTASQSMPAAAGMGKGKRYDSVANKSYFRHHLSSHGKQSLQSHDRQEPNKSLNSATENLFMPLQVIERASIESEVKHVSVEKQRSSKQALPGQSKDLSVEKLEMSPLGKLQNLSEDNVADSQWLSQDEHFIYEKLSVDEEVIYERLSQEGEVIFLKMSADEGVISGNLSHNDKNCEILSQDRIEKPRKHEESICENLVQDETDVFGHVSQGPSQNDVALSERPSQLGIEMLRQAEVVISQMPTEDETETSKIVFQAEQSFPQEGSLGQGDALLLTDQTASVKEAFYSPVPPPEQPVVFLDRQRRLFSVPAKKDLGLKFGHFDDCDSSAPDESRTPPFPGPINVVHYVPVPYNHEDRHDKPLADSNSLMFPIAHQYMPQLMYANGPLPPLCKPAFQVYPNSHLFPVPMPFAPFVPPGFCVVPHPANVPVGVVSPTMNNRTREETSSSECADVDAIIMDGGDSCVASFAARQSMMIPTEPLARPNLQPEPAEVTVVTSVSLSSSGKRKSVFDMRAAVEYLYSEWLEVTRREREPNGGVVRYSPELDL